MTTTTLQRSKLVSLICGSEPGDQLDLINWVCGHTETPAEIDRAVARGYIRHDHECHYEVIDSGAAWADVEGRR